VNWVPLVPVSESCGSVSASVLLSVVVAVAPLLSVAVYSAVMSPWVSWSGGLKVPLAELFEPVKTVVPSSFRVRSTLLIVPSGSFAV